MWGGGIKVDIMKIIRSFVRHQLLFVLRVICVMCELLMMGLGVWDGAGGVGWDWISC